MQPSGPQTFLESALAYDRRGWSVIPIKHKSPKGKEPACRWSRYQSERPTQATLGRWFSNGKLDGLAVILGPVSGNLVCRDFDELDAYDRWADEHPDLATTLPTVETARGRHVYATAATDRILQLQDGEVRGGGYCLLPPSRHPTGAEYRWLVPLPEGPLPEIDPVAAGWVADVTESTETTETTEHIEHIEAMVGGGAPFTQSRTQ